MTKVQCANCDWQGFDTDCYPVKDVLERVAPGEIMPAGECPECGAVCHPSKPEFPQLLPVFFKFEATVVSEGCIWTDDLGARSMSEAEAVTIDAICNAWGWDRSQWPEYEDDDQWQACGAWPDFVENTDGASIIRCNNVGGAAMSAYRGLAEGLSDMIQGGRLTEADIPDDFKWLVNQLALIAGRDPSPGVNLAAPDEPHLRTDLPKGLSESDDPHLIRSSYACPRCGNEWESTWDSACDDDCGVCGTSDISPVSFVDVEDCDCGECRKKKEGKTDD